MPTLVPPISAFCDQLVAHDLPELPAERRAAVVTFTERRTEELPTPMRVGVTIVAAAVAVLSKIVGGGRMASFLARRPLPLVGEYVRLLRSLAYAYVWETWPSTAPSGAALDVVAEAPGGAGGPTAGCTSERRDRASAKRAGAK